MPVVTLSGQQMYYEDHGAGFPLLFGHSYLWNAAMWQPQIEVLSGSYRCIVPELWGHGRSDPPPETPYSIEAMAREYWDFVEALGLDRFAMIGLSVGGMWGAHLTLNHPEAVATLVLMDTHIGAEPEETRLLYFAMLDAVEQMGEFPEDLAATVAFMFFSPKTVQNNQHLVDGFKDYLMAEPTERIPGVVGIGRGIFGRNSVLERLGEIRTPTLVVVGEDDQPRPPHEAREMADLIPDARLEIVKEAGHICTLEQSDEVAALLATFLAESL